MEKKNSMHLQKHLSEIETRTDVKLASPLKPSADKTKPNQSTNSTTVV